MPSEGVSYNSRVSGRFMCSVPTVTAFLTRLSAAGAFLRLCVTAVTASCMLGKRADSCRYVYTLLAVHLQRYATLSHDYFSHPFLIYIYIYNMIAPSLPCAGLVSLLRSLGLELRAGVTTNTGGSRPR